MLNCYNEVRGITCSAGPWRLSTTFVLLTTEFLSRKNIEELRHARRPLAVVCKVNPDFILLVVKVVPLANLVPCDELG